MISTVLLIIAVGVFAYAAFQLITIYLAYKTGVDEYKELNEYVSSEEIEGPDTYQEQESPEWEGIEGLDQVKIDWEPEWEKDMAEGIDLHAWMDGEITAETDAEGDFRKVTNYNGDVVAKLPMKENPVDFESLCEMNKDVIGWLKMEAIDISYPLVKGKDNDYYLHRTFQKTDNFAGSIFVDYLNDKKFRDQNTIVYGHNMKNGSMFGILKQYGSKETYEKSPYFWIYTPDFIFKYEIFSCAEVNSTGSAYQIRFNTKEDFLEYLYNRRDNAYYETDIKLFPTDRIVTLSTCTGNDATRFIVQGKRVKAYRAYPKPDGYKEEG